MIPSIQFLTPIRRGIRLVYVWCGPNPKGLICLTIRLEELFDPEMREIIRYYNALYGGEARVLQPIRNEDITL
jgi:hypothetical protein